MAEGDPVVKDLLETGDSLRAASVRRKAAIEAERLAKEERLRLTAEYEDTAERARAAVLQAAEDGRYNSQQIAEMLGINVAWVKRVRVPGASVSVRTPGTGPKMLRPPPEDH
jgi:DNA-directed RNA polymerase specialized sigma24 family protein